MKLPIHSGNVTHLLEVRFLSKSPKMTIYTVQYSSFRDVIGITVDPSKEDEWVADIVSKCAAMDMILVEYISIYRKGKVRRSLLVQQDKLRLRVVLIPKPSTLVL